MRGSSLRFGKGALAAVLIVLLLAATLSMFYKTSHIADRVEHLENTVSQARTVISKINSTLASYLNRTNIQGKGVEGLISMIGGQLESLNSTISSVQRQVAGLGSPLLGNLRERVDLLLNRTAALRSQMNQTRWQLAELESQFKMLNTSFGGPTGSASAITRLNQSLSRLSQDVSALRSTLQNLVNRTPAHIYQQVHRSVVMIRTDLGQGSGFFYGPGLILTNWHVVKGASSIEVEFYDQQRSPASLVGGDPYADVALIRVDSPPGVESLVLGNSSEVWVGEQVVAIGNPLGLRASLSSGYVAQVNKLLNIPPIIVPVLELDVTIAPGSSGGPLFDLSGQVIGITNAGTGYGINFAVPSNIVRRVAKSILETGTYQHPFVGVSLVQLSPETIRSLNVINVDPFQTGLMIVGVSSGTPAERAGLRPALRTQDQRGNPAYEARDIILGVNGHRTWTFEDWAAYVEENVSPGQRLTLQLWRNGSVEEVALTATSRPPYQGS